MHKTSLRKVGGSVMLTVPPAMLELLHLEAGSSVGMAVDGSRLIIEAKSRARYKLDELLSQCNADASPSIEDAEWAQSGSVGGEIL